MSFAFASGHLCLQEWDEPLLVDHVVSLLLNLREVSTTTLARPILIIVTRPTAFAKASLPEVLQTALPAILEGCAELIIVAEPADARGSVLRAILRTPSSARGGRKSPRHFESLDQALGHVQRTAPHDVLELRRQSLRRSLPPSGVRR